MPFTDNLSPRDQKQVDQLRKIIIAADPAVIEETGPIMSAKDALCYTEKHVMKYGLAATKTGITFHSMIMYVNPDIAEFVKRRLTGVKLQKGCINIPNLEKLDLKAFEDMLRLSAEKDFGPVVARYQKTRMS